MERNLEASESIRRALFRQVAKKGMANSLIPHYLRELKKSIYIRPGKSHSEINEHMHYLGWREIDVDYHTFQLAKECMNRDKHKEIAA
ncbi:MAG: hypothetical protein C4576_32240 [Desulfobacteraceae bacterium]|nr:MAG: hypothetical protein C4576_32240 [Desulfobacteraceae bacterium]